MVCKDIVKEEECVDMLKEAFGEPLVREMMKRVETTII